LSPDHLFEQAERLIGELSGGRPRQVDLRRALSAAYYGVFHFCLTMAADEIVGVSRRSTRRYALVYRSIDHRALRELCKEAAKSSLSSKITSYLPRGFDPHVKAFAAAVLDLQELRVLADYDPQVRFRTSDARLAVALGRKCIQIFQQAVQENQRTFLTLLVCPPR
jgi:hypothetical protein